MAYTPAQEYTAETPDSIRQAVTKVQKRARARLLPIEAYWVMSKLSKL